MTSTCLWVAPSQDLYHDDADLLKFVGNGKLTEPQERLHFGLWAIAKSPLVIGADLSDIPESSLEILKNKVRRGSSWCSRGETPLTVCLGPHRY